MILFVKVWGIRLEDAKRLYEKGLRTLEDLRNNSHLLTSYQNLGLKYFEDTQISIPFDEVTKMFEIIKRCLYEILPEDAVEVKLCGSYRRKKTSCDDINVLITRKDYGPFENLLDTLLEKLKTINFIKDSLGFNKIFRFNSMKNQFYGICKLKEDLPFRRIEIKVILFNNLGV